MSEFEHGPKRAIHGICVHTTGDGIPAEVEKRAAKSPPNWATLHLDVAREVYVGMGLVGPHYVIDPYGSVEKYAKPELVRYHAGVAAEERRSFLDGHWEEDANRIPRDVVAWWKRRWPGIKSPSHLYPSKSPNKDYIGIELIPAGSYVKSKAGSTSWQFQHGSRPGFDKQRFSVEQYCALAMLCNQLAETHGLDLEKPGVLVGHEDVNPYSRPGWDPGDKIEAFSWNLLNGLLKHVQPL
jgi:N-acetyl-anhydromuramyl-L-alanine amidase AmpD